MDKLIQKKKQKKIIIFNWENNQIDQILSQRKSQQLLYRQTKKIMLTNRKQ